ncbi:hypothetical protein SAMN05216189_101163 [Pseudomonas delhiensis]|uniref:Uncharacterized protein n=1 Tax=Pseudomonas delhiensis TaxID=366289 RepID=A0A239K2C6_9PSED|nr:hypothetical protein SAMN05216189_101163 [Pseudomonas delhiensis]SNT11938.1 hypothetical protein SAMN06295949_11463 [Pseudomonas delhiensis]
MGLNQTQLDQLGRQLDNNPLEVLILSAEQANLLAADHATSHWSPTQAPSLCVRDDITQASGLLDSIRPHYNDSLHEFVNTAWGMPALLGSHDAVNFARFVRDMGGLNTRVRYVNHNGRQYVVLSGYPGLRRILTGTRYSVTNTRLIEMGIGRYGIRGSSLSGFKLSCYFAVGVEFLEWFFNSEVNMLDLLGGIGVELVKAGIASAVGYAVAVAAGSILGFAAAPVIAGALLVFIVGVGLNWLDKRYGIKQRVQDSLNYATDNASMIAERFQELDSRKIRSYVEHTFGEVVDAAVDYATQETKSWILRRLPSGTLPEPPYRLPNLDILKFPKL